jgi:hypothetical protein
MIRILFIFKARRFFHIDFLFDRSVQEGTLDVHLIKLEIIVSSIDKGLATGAKVSSKSKPLTCEYPFATSLSFFLVTTPYSSCLIQNTHLLSTIFCFDLSTKNHT